MCEPYEKVITKSDIKPSYRKQFAEEEELDILKIAEDFLHAQ